MGAGSAPSPIYIATPAVIPRPIHSLFFRTCFILTGLIASAAEAELDIRTLMIEGNQARLQGNMTLANEIRDQIRDLAPEDPASYAFNLNTIVTELSWEESQSRFDNALQADAEKLIDLCEARKLSPSEVNSPNFYCGQAHFTLSYYNGIRGNLITAGRHGTQAIEYMEAALATDPGLTRAKMYLGIAYYYADNLPPFVKLFSRLLWFIPSGNSEKSLPYLREVMASNDEFSDVARYIYATLLINGSEEELQEALSELEILLARYPENVRFQLRYVSIIQGDGRYQDTLDSIEQFLAMESAQSLSMIDSNLLSIWLARANLGLNNFTIAEEVQSTIQFDPQSTTVPAWGLAWFELTNGQLADLKGNHQKARQAYERIIELDKRTFVNPSIVRLANQFIESPFVMITPGLGLE